MGKSIEQLKTSSICSSNNHQKKKKMVHDLKILPRKINRVERNNNSKNEELVMFHE